jgi:hypothetical protein
MKLGGPSGGGIGRVDADTPANVHPSLLRGHKLSYVCSFDLLGGNKEERRKRESNTFSRESEKGKMLFNCSSRRNITFIAGANNGSI